MLPVVFFNNVTAVPKVVPLTFQVNLAAQIAQGNFDPAAGTVSVAGDVINNWSATASVLTNSATDPNLWLGTLDLTTSVGSTILYKFVLNEGGTWESGDNRSFTVADTNAQTLPLAFFNRVNDLGRLSIGPVAGGQATLSWTAGPRIRLQEATDLTPSTWRDVPGTLGQSSTTLSIGSGKSFFRLVGP